MKKTISIISGTLNRKENVKRLVESTIEKYNFLELVLVDGGSTDGTVEYIESLNYENLIFVNYGKRSSYPHFMNLGILNSSCEFICIWDDDAVLINSWTEVLTILDEQKSDFYIFNWKLGDDISSINNPECIVFQNIFKSNEDFINGAKLVLDIINRKEKICILEDYDVDVSCATNPL